jgi:hypothetical protein
MLSTNRVLPSIYRLEMQVGIYSDAPVVDLKKTRA